MKSRFTGYFLAVCTAFLVTCSNNRLDVDLSNLNVQPRFVRFDQQLFDTPVEGLAEANQRFKSEYSTFYRNYVEAVINVGMVEDPALPSGLKSFVTYPDVREIAEMVAATYPDIEQTKAELVGALRYYHYHFPEKPIPNVYTFISGLNAGIMVGDQYLGIGLDWYLGEKCPYYVAKGFPQYQIKQQTSEFIARDAMALWMRTEYPYDDRNETLLQRMVYEGKVLYLLDAFFQDRPDHWKIGFSTEQLAWCQDKEFNIWGHLVDEKYLYSSELKVIRQFTGEGPFTRDFEKTSPARTGSWLGWKIVREFMNSNPEVSLAGLMQMKDPQELLARSGYRP
ncbi:MAG: hypothetical protein ACFB10_07235 [Salibacteraceae bacterium]